MRWLCQQRETVSKQSAAQAPLAPVDQDCFAWLQTPTPDQGIANCCPHRRVASCLGCRHACSRIALVKGGRMLAGCSMKALHINHMATAAAQATAQAKAHHLDAAQTWWHGCAERHVHCHIGANATSRAHRHHQLTHVELRRCLRHSGVHLHDGACREEQ